VPKVGVEFAGGGRTDVATAPVDGLAGVRIWATPTGGSTLTRIPSLDEAGRVIGQASLVGPFFIN
jgi:hypothetical protein